MRITKAILGVVLAGAMLAGFASPASATPAPERAKTTDIVLAGHHYSPTWLKGAASALTYSHGKLAAKAGAPAKLAQFAADVNAVPMTPALRRCQDGIRASRNGNDVAIKLPACVLTDARSIATFIGAIATVVAATGVGAPVVPAITAVIAAEAGALAAYSVWCDWTGDSGDVLIGMHIISWVPPTVNPAPSLHCL